MYLIKYYAVNIFIQCLSVDICACSIKVWSLMLHHSSRSRMMIRLFFQLESPSSQRKAHSSFLPSFLPSSPPESLSVLLSRVEIIYHYIQHTDAPQLLCPENACSHSAIKAKRHPLPPALEGAWERRGKERGGEERGG